MERFDLGQRAGTLLIGVGAVWAVSLVGLFAYPELQYLLAVIPRRLDSLGGLLGMPLVHGSLGHLIANTGPLVIFGAILLSRGRAYFLWVTLAIALVGGLLVWLFGRQSAHIGASGVIFGYFGFLVLRGLYERRLSSLTVTLIVTFVYSGGMVFGLVPQPGVSWEGHLFGLIAGLGVARVAFALDKRKRAVAEAEPRSGAEHAG